MIVVFALLKVINGRLGSWLFGVADRVLGDLFIFSGACWVHFSVLRQNATEIHNQNGVKSLRGPGAYFWWSGDCTEKMWLCLTSLTRSRWTAVQVFVIHSHLPLRGPWVRVQQFCLSVFCLFVWIKSWRRSLFIQLLLGQQQVRWTRYCATLRQNGWKMRASASPIYSEILSQQILILLAGDTRNPDARSIIANSCSAGDGDTLFSSAIFRTQGVLHSGHMTDMIIGDKYS